MKGFITNRKDTLLTYCERGLLK
ncbi:hypothetical protein IM043_gp271 [Bacillus phage SPG24]|nr:hypothetical protein IM043_gp271 [Bacillus phage SPG24]